jgi:hypothetical protein
LPRATARNWIEIGSQLRSRLTVAKVVCLVDQPQGWRPRNFSAPRL